MCLILFAVAAHPDYPLVIAANRDEHYARPTRPLQAWPEAPQLFAGKDLEAGGTWLGITRSGRFAAITNVREGAPREPWQRSRGELTHDFLLGSGSVEEFAEFAHAQGENYAGFNLLLGDLSHEANGLHYCSNRGVPPQRVAAGIYGLSNDRLDTPWPKVETGKRALRELLTRSPTQAALLDILSDRTQPPDSALPHTYLGVELERVYASRFIASPLYGTRASTALLIDSHGHVHIWEQNFDSNGRIGSLLKYDWPLQPGDANA
jgi:uncharacterized protein with NRDE domain